MNNTNGARVVFTSAALGPIPRGRCKRLWVSVSDQFGAERLLSLNLPDITKAGPRGKVHDHERI